MKQLSKDIKLLIAKTLTKTEKAIQYTSCILIGTVAIAIGRIVPHHSIKTEISKFSPTIENVHKHTRSIATLQEMVNRLYQKATNYITTLSNH